MKNFVRITCSLTLCAALASCLSVVSTRKVTGDSHAKGFRYKLPQPYILATPQADGSIKYEELTLPDDDQEYAIHSFAIGANYKLDASAPKGMLASVSTTMETSALAKQLVDSNAGIASTYIDEAGKRRVASDAKEAAAETSVEAKELALKLAQEELNRLPATATPETRAAAELKVAKAQIELDFARRQYRAVVGANKTAGGDLVPGPVLYKVIDKGDQGVQLVAVKFTGGHPQAALHSSSKVKPSPPTAAEPTIALKSPSTLSRQKIGGSMELDVKASTDIASLTVKLVKNLDTSETVPSGQVSANRTDISSYRVTVSPVPANGRYEIRMEFTPQGEGNRVQALFNIFLTD